MAELLKAKQFSISEWFSPTQHIPSSDHPSTQLCEIDELLIPSIIKFWLERAFAIFEIGQRLGIQGPDLVSAIDTLIARITVEKFAAQKRGPKTCLKIAEQEILTFSLLLLCEIKSLLEKGLQLGASGNPKVEEDFARLCSLL